MSVLLWLMLIDTDYEIWKCYLIGKLHAPDESWTHDLQGEGIVGGSCQLS